MIYAYYILVVLLFATTAILTAEATVFDGGSLFIVADEDSGSRMETGRYEDDYFWGGSNLDFSGIADDLYLMGRNIDYNGESAGSATIFGENIEIHGIVAKNLHSASNDIRITGRIAETAFIAAQNITISKEAVIDGTLLSGSSTLHIMGQLNNGLLAGAGEIIIDGPVAGNVEVHTGKLIITERGSIDGNLIYGSNVEISETEKARVSGTVAYKVKEELDKTRITTFCIIVAVLFFLTLVVSGLLLLLFPGVKRIFTPERDFSSYGKTVLWGLIPLFIYPVIMLITIPLFPLSIALGLSAFPLLGLSTILGLAFAGQLLFKVFKWENKSIYLQFLFAFAIYLILVLIPFVKVPVVLAVSAAGAGLLISRLFRTEF